MWAAAVPVAAAWIGGMFDSDSDDEDFERARREREAAEAAAREAAAQAAAENLAREEARLSMELTIAERASQIASQRVGPARARHNQAINNTASARAVLAQLQNQAQTAIQQVDNSANKIARMVAEKLYIEERINQRRQGAPHYQGEMAAIQIIADSEIADADACIREARNEHTAALHNQNETQRAVGLAHNQVAERDRLENEAQRIYNTAVQNQTDFANRATNARNVLQQKTQELAPEVRRITPEFRRQAAQEATRPVENEAAARVPAEQAPTVFSGIDRQIAQTQEAMRDATERMAQLAAENLARHEARLNVAAIVAECASQIATDRVAPAKSKYDEAQKETAKAKVVLAQLEAKAQVAHYELNKASDNMASKVAHRLLVEERTKQRIHDASSYPGGLEVINITSASELTAARTAGIQANIEREAALTNQRESDEAVRLGKNQLAEREFLENEARVNYERILEEQAQFEAIAKKARQTVEQKTQELAPVVHRISAAFRQEAARAAVKTEQQIQREAVARLPLVPTPTPFSGIDKEIAAAEVKMQNARTEMARLAAETELKRLEIEKAAEVAKDKTEKKSRIIAHNHKRHYQRQDTYAPEIIASTQASADVWTAKNLVIEHHTEEEKNQVKLEKEAGALATVYYAKIKEAALVAIEKAERELRHVENRPYLPQFLESQRKVQQAYQALEKIKAEEAQARQAVEDKFPNAKDFLSIDLLSKQELTQADKKAQKLLVEEHAKAEQRLHNEQAAAALRALQKPAPSVLTTAQVKLLLESSQELLQFILKYSLHAITTEGHDIFRLQDPNLSLVTRIFLWDLICISAVYAQEVTHSTNSQKNALWQMQKFLTPDARGENNSFDQSLSRMSQRLQVATDGTLTTERVEEVHIPLDNYALQTAANAVSYLKRHAQALQMTGRYTLFNSAKRASVRDKRFVQEQARFKAAVNEIETAASDKELIKMQTSLLDEMIDIGASKQEQTARQIKIFNMH